jgi:hypothetical protein
MIAALFSGMYLSVVSAADNSPIATTTVGRIAGTNSKIHKTIHW